MKTTFTLLLLFVSFLSVGQTKFVKGYYVTQHNDTVHTFLNDRNWSKNPKTFLVSENAEGTNISKINILDVKSLRLSTGDWFERYLLPIDKSPVNISEIKIDAEPVIVVDTVLLRVIVKGYLNLLYLKDKSNKEHFFIQRGSDMPQELILRKVKRNVGGNVMLLDIPIYKTSLLEIMQDCSQGAGIIENTHLSFKSLQNLVLSYNQCKSGNETGYSAKSQKFITSLGILAGGSYTSMQFKGRGFDELSQNKFIGSGQAAGISIDVKLPRLHNQWSVYNELLWKSYHVEGDYEYIFSSENFKRSHSEISMTSIGLNTMIRYKLDIAASLKPYLNIGIANNFGISYTNKKTTQRRFYSDYPDAEGKALEDIRTYEQAIVAGVGLNYKKMTAELRYELGNGVSSYHMLSSTKSMLGLKLGYSLR
ncbi:outer membrane beta-barrel protein [Pontibacter sp. H249]|uniref:outer membrane beta-barrel protein n=1 Tax=Pontibacter sp. H249 TaxID=3133420 RepID=UPI0030C5F16B